MGNEKPATGDKRWSESKGRWESWSGKGWVPALYSANMQRLQSPAAFDSEPPVDAEKRERLLKKVVTEEVMNGATVVHQDRFFAIFSVRKKVRHLTHALLSVLTLGVWTTVWIVLTIARREDRFRVDVDQWGNAWAQESTSS